MGDTFSAFVKFISDDPIMLGLCIAIIVLVILFIIVLVVGKKKDKEKEKDNTAELLKTDINLDILESTQQYRLSDLQGIKEHSKEEKKNDDVKPSLDTVLNTSEPIDVFQEPAIDIPVETNAEGTSLEIKETIIKEPIIESFHEEPASAPQDISPNNHFSSFDMSMTNSSNGGFPTTEEFNLNVSSPAIIESKIEPVIEETNESASGLNMGIPEEPQISSLDTNSIVESAVNPIEQEFYKGADSLIDFNKSELENINNDFEKTSFKEVGQSFDSIDQFDFAPVDTKMFNTKTDPTIEEPIPVLEEATIEFKTFDEPQIERKYEAPAFEPIQFVEEKVEIPEDEKIEIPVKPIEQPKSIEPFSSIYLNTETIELPEIKVDNFSKTAILRNLPIMESMPGLEDMNDVLPKSSKESEEDLDDLDLPKLSNIAENASVINSLQGESFDIE